MDQNAKDMIQRVLENKNLWQLVDQEESQFLRVDYLFAHLVLRDASAYEQVMETMRSLSAETKHTSGDELRFVVRSTWVIEKVEYVGPYYGRDGQLRTSVALRAELQSGTRHRSMTIAVTHLAAEQLYSRAGLTKLDNAGQRALLIDTAHTFLTVLLAGRGTAEAWDPLWQDEDLHIDHDTSLWLRSRG